MKNKSIRFWWVVVLVFGMLGTAHATMLYHQTFDDPLGPEWTINDYGVKNSVQMDQRTNTLMFAAKGTATLKLDLAKFWDQLTMPDIVAGLRLQTNGQSTAQDKVRIDLAFDDNWPAGVSWSHFLDKNWSYQILPLIDNNDSWPVGMMIPKGVTKDSYVSLRISTELGDKSKLFVDDLTVHNLPEPTATLLLGIGLLGLVGYGWRVRKQ